MKQQEKKRFFFYYVILLGMKIRGKNVRIRWLSLGQRKTMNREFFNLNINFEKKFALLIVIFYRPIFIKNLENKFSSI